MRTKENQNKNKNKQKKKNTFPSKTTFQQDSGHSFSDQQSPRIEINRIKFANEKINKQMNQEMKQPIQRMKSVPFETLIQSSSISLLASKKKKQSHPTTSTIKKTKSKLKQIELLLHFRIERDKKTSRKECKELHKTKTILLLLLLGVFQSLLSIVNGKLGFFFLF